MSVYICIFVYMSLYIYIPTYTYMPTFVRIKRFGIFPLKDNDGSLCGWDFFSYCCWKKLVLFSLSL